MPRKLFKVSGEALEFEEGLCSPVQQVKQIVCVESGDKYGSFNTIAL